LRGDDIRRRRRRREGGERLRFEMRNVWILRTSLFLLAVKKKRRTEENYSEER